MNTSLNKEKLNEINVPRCEKCKAVKTLQIHHCKYCNRCVFMMDHHCWWTNNCVGYNSYRPFFLFCIYLTLSTIFGVTTIIYNFRTKNRQFDEGIKGFKDLFYKQVGGFGITNGSCTMIQILDIWLLQGSLLFGSLACIMTGGILYSTIRNKNQITELKEKEDPKLARQNKLVPTRTFR